MPSRLFPNVLSTDLPRSRHWYVSLLGFEAEYDSDWFVHLRSPEEELVTLGILAVDQDIVNPAMAERPTGGVITVVVDDVDAVHAVAQAAGATIVEAPRNLFYGQRRLLLADPDGQIVDVSSPCDPDPDWLASLGG
ncbi:MAG: VOC family protein [Actinomycetota bacterium]